MGAARSTLLAALVGTVRLGSFGTDAAAQAAAVRQVPTPEESDQEAKKGLAICLGNCFDCHSYLETLPRDRLAAAATHVDATRVRLEDFENWLSSPQVCDVRHLFPLSTDRHVWSLASLPAGVEQLSFPGASRHMKLAAERCEALQELAVQAFSEAKEALNCQEGGSCSQDAVGRLLDAWSAVRRPPAEHSLPPVYNTVRLTGNETMEFLEAMARSVDEAFLVAGSLVASGPLHFPLGKAVDRGLARLASDLGKTARQQTDLVRTVWGLRQLLVEIQTVYPTAQQMFPELRFHTQLFGRHWDILEWLLHHLEGQPGRGGRPLRMAELGVACGPIGLHLLPRFPSLRYFGADPTVPHEVRQAYVPYKSRATLFETTSEEMNQAVEGSFDLVFIDGPHTYKNVNNDLRIWVPRVRRGGIVAGHDFTCRHPPLLWAVSEYRISSGGSHINVGMDGVWWWQVL